MCHVLQSLTCFETWPADIVRLKFPEEHWDYYISRYEHFATRSPHNLTPKNYLIENAGTNTALTLLLLGNGRYGVHTV